MLVVTGYASLDYVMYLEGPSGTERTTRAVRTAWPRVGGCPSYIARAASQADLKAAPLMWVGDDLLGDWLKSELQGFGLLTEGVTQISGARSPVAVLTYDPDGACTCLYDPGAPGKEFLTDSQKHLIGQASHLCISVGPPQVTEDILSARAPNARLYWAMKDDVQSFTPEICAALSASTDVIFCNRAERARVPSTSAIVVETRGAGGVSISIDGNETLLTVSPSKCRDMSGLGDSFAGGFIAAEMSGATPIEAAQAGITAANRLLAKRERSSL
jgi:sugar/nucleoside kinase (ribokinase family)